MAQQPAEPWLQLEEAFRLAAGKPPGERAALIDRSCGDDHDLRARLVQMLAAHDQQGSLLDAPALDELWPADGADHAAPTLAGRRIGQYRITRVIASGGMGTVYEAQQEHPDRAIAIKVMHAGIATPSMLRRFQVEVDILGRLQHPGIAQVHEAGVFESDDGPQPFFAMELIDGCSITDYARRHELGTRDRLALLAKVCEGVEHAHAKGVIHRDLKPGNILVDHSGQPKILDFGIARAAGADGRTTTLRTGVGALMGTLAYMSPEQVAGDPAAVDRQADVFALGVIAYELLAGRLPHDLRQRSIPEALRILREEEPTPLSSVDRLFRGDLDTIIAKALEKDKERRYGSASAFAADIERFLRDEPVLARRPSSRYQFYKFARRNRVLVGGIAAVFLALALGVIATSWQWARAAHQRDQVDKARMAALQAQAEATKQLAHTRDAALDLLSFADKELADLPGGTKARHALALAALQRLASVAGSPELERSLAISVNSSLAYAHQRLGEVQLVMGRTAGALESFQNLMAIRVQQAEDVPDDRATLRALGVAHAKVGDALLQLGRLDEAERHHAQSRRTHEQIMQRWNDSEPDRGVYHGITHRRIAETAAAAGASRAAEGSYRRAIEFLNASLGADPDWVPALRSKALSLCALGALCAQDGRTDAALDLFANNLAVIDHLSRIAGSANAWESLNRARCMGGVAEARLKAGDLPRALDASAEAIAIARALAAADADNHEYRHVLAQSCAARSAALAEGGQFGPAAEALRESVELLGALRDLDADNAWVKRDFERFQQRLAALPSAPR